MSRQPVRRVLSAARTGDEPLPPLPAAASRVPVARYKNQAVVTEMAYAAVRAGAQSAGAGGYTQLEPDHVRNPREHEVVQRPGTNLAGYEVPVEAPAPAAGGEVGFDYAVVKPGSGAAADGDDGDAAAPHSKYGTVQPFRGPGRKLSHTQLAGSVYAPPAAGDEENPFTKYGTVPRKTGGGRSRSTIEEAFSKAYSAQSAATSADAGAPPPCPEDDEPPAEGPCMALFDFAADELKQLPFRMGDTIHVLQPCPAPSAEGVWLMARDTAGEQGWVPSSYLAAIPESEHSRRLRHIRLTEHVWLQPELDGAGAENELSQLRPGRFLVRKTSRFAPGSWSLCVQQFSEMSTTLVQFSRDSFEVKGVRRGRERFPSLVAMIYTILLDPEAVDVPSRLVLPPLPK